MCGKFGLERANKWYEHEAAGVVENEEVKILWDFMIQCDRMVKHRKPDIVLIHKKENKCVIVDVAIPNDEKVATREE